LLGRPLQAAQGVGRDVVPPRRAREAGLESFAKVLVTPVNDQPAAVVGPGGGLEAKARGASRADDGGEGSEQDRQSAKRLEAPSKLLERLGLKRGVGQEGIKYGFCCEQVRQAQVWKA
jgi:hypothetical protein